MSETDVEEAELPLEGIGARLLRAREAAGMSRAQVAAITRIPERHLTSIEDGNFSALPSRTYAVGFSRSYAKAVGLDADEIVTAVRGELVDFEPAEPRRGIPTFEPGDPARVPGSRLVWLSALGIIAVLAGLFFLYRSMIAPGMTLPSILSDEPAVAAQSEAAPAAVPAPTGPVVFTALDGKVWVKFTDGAGNQLFQKEMVQGESWTVPADQTDVRIMTARPEALAITIGGQSVPKLAEVQTTIRDVPVTASALLSRGTAAAVPVPVETPNAQPPRQQQSQPRQRDRRSAPVAQPAASPAASTPAVAPANEPPPAPAAAPSASAT
ncbi:MULTISPECIES: helix-turn-helix domain-containing protein [unclassified Novosphingobium]|uniref:helix-turn-helix domain-containing protein n=1 Tax=unclassified Novosphingobium TaxID=2644732 RepID=UPI0025FAD390|nr:MULTISPECIES: helix-turn-helix domain-containing protein [unclassified Novosphingobium]HQV02038.1 DUF4115 domain-containing protein [Novosphingobium sp.]